MNDTHDLENRLVMLALLRDFYSTNIDYPDKTSLINARIVFVRTLSTLGLLDGDWNG
jgi:hypothetical protein